MRFIEELEKLSLTPDFMTEAQAGQVIYSINTKISAILRPHLIDVLWRTLGHESVILDPVKSACINNTNGARVNTLPYPILEDTTGVWAWVYWNDKPAWIKSIKSTTRRKLRNEITRGLLDQQRLDIFKETDTIIAVPLKVENVLCGIYSIEWPTSEKIDSDTLKIIELIAKPIARICWKAEISKVNQDQTTDAIKLFNAAILNSATNESLSPVRTGFIARSFEDKFESLEETISKHLTSRGIHARSYEYTPGGGVVILNILDQLTQSHFGIIEITGNNSNVMLELGAMMALKKDFILLRRADDNTPVPFDIAPFHYYLYKERKGVIHLFKPGSHQTQTVEEMLDLFISHLEKDPVFLKAKKAGPVTRGNGKRTR